MNAHVGSVILTDAPDAPDAPPPPPRFLLGVDNCLGAVPSKYASIAASSSSALKSKYFGAVNSHLRRRHRHKVTKSVYLSLSRLNASFNFNSISRASRALYVPIRRRRGRSFVRHGYFPRAVRRIVDASSVERVRAPMSVDECRKEETALYFVLLVA